MRNCMLECIECDRPCVQKECRQWINYDDDLNCTLVSVEKHGNLTLREVADRMQVSFVRVKQIQDQGIEKFTRAIKKFHN